MSTLTETRSNFISNWSGETRDDSINFITTNPVVNLQWNKDIPLELDGDALIFTNIENEQIGIENIYGVIDRILRENLNEDYFNLIYNAGLITPIDNLEEFLADNNCLFNEEERLVEGTDYDIYEYVDMMIEMGEGILIDSNSILL